MAEIHTDEWFAEMDAILATARTNSPIINDLGFTIYDFMERRGLGRVTASRIMKGLERQGKIKHVGYRSGRNGAKVYEVIKDHIKE
jgi:CRP-like cAMP-binding protein